VVVHADDLQEHVFMPPGARIMSSAVQLGKGRHFEAPNMA